MSVLQFLLMSRVMHTYRNNWLFVCVLSIKKGEPVEQFLGLVQIEDTTSLTLKEVIQFLLIKYQLSLFKLCVMASGGAQKARMHDRWETEASNA